ncbi:hypothetical protein BESB_057610 [Besnoitia besnoiti]|uniref:Uncharacterized protein n=1 Tax=Besnoitia besnoiti TaxID=94643 RepID=A0A2A9MKZ3_BESBE|nr:hypothetical protein BESB_057610 [Besnoitia besnoiti]PFH36110.1 hypothetical protein BESB_057610 [Besnoitia besnoiti]
MGEARRRASCSAETTTAAGNKGTTHWQRGIRRLGPAEPRSPRGSSRAPALAQPLLSKGGSTAFEARANAPPPGPEVAARLRTGIPLPFWAPRGPIRCRVTWAEPAFVHRESSQEIRQEPKSAQFPAVRSLGGARRL